MKVKQRAIPTHGINMRQLREWLVAYAFLTPQIIGLVVFIGGPLLVSLYYSFTHWDLVSPAPTWVGLSNWSYFFQDPRIGKVLWNTVRFVLTSVPSFLILSLLSALILNKARKGITIFRALFLLPWVMSQIAIGVAWTWMFNTRSGPIAQFFKLIGAEIPNMLLDKRFAMTAIAMVSVWQTLGYGMVIYLAGLKNIPSELYDAAKVDGATPSQWFRYITFPLLSPTTLFLTITSLIGAFQLFDLVVIMSSIGGGLTVLPGGPDGSTRTIVLYLYNQMLQYSEKYSGLGYAAVIAWVLAALIFALTLVQWKLSKRWVFYNE